MKARDSPRRRKGEILRLYDKPYALGEIAEQLDLPVTVVRETLMGMTAGLDHDVPWMRVVRHAG